MAQEWLTAGTVFFFFSISATGYYITAAYIVTSQGSFVQERFNYEEWSYQTSTPKADNNDS